MNIKEFALLLRNRLLNGVSPEIIAREINSKNFTDEQKRQIIDYIEYINSYDSRMRNYSDIDAFLELVSEVKRRVIGGK